MSCDTEKCGAACCTFVTQWEGYPITPDHEHYLNLHGITVKRVSKGAWLKLPIPCTAFNPDTKRCMVWKARPDICRKYPQHESPFIAKSQCSLLHASLQKSCDTSYEGIFTKHWERYIDAT